VSSEAQISILDIQGRVVISSISIGSPVSLASLPKGMYFVKVTDQGERYLKKVLKQ
jgi:hypothetical protein